MLNRIEESYNKLRKKEFQFILEDDNIITLRFKKVNLPHLIGIGKLGEDDKTIKKFVNKQVSAKDILKKLKDENKTYDVIKKYDSWTGHLTRRMSNFNYSNINLLIRQSVVIDFKYDSFKTNNDKAKFIFYAEIDAIHLHLFIGEDEINKYYYPNSFTAEFEKNRNSGAIKKIKVSKIIIQDGSIVEEIDHNYYKNIIRGIRPKIKNINKLISTLNGAKRKDEDEERISELHNQLNSHRLDLMESFKNINDYIPINDFLRLKNNKKILKYYETLDPQYLILNNIV